MKDGKLVQVKGAPVTREVKLNLSEFIDNPRKGEQERRCNNSLRTAIAILAKIKDCPQLPGHETLAVSGDTPALLDQIVCNDHAGTIRLRDLQNKDIFRRVEEKLSDERKAETRPTESTLLRLMADIHNFGRTY